MYRLSKKTILITAGGTGGHVFPALSVAKKLQSKYNVLWVGAKIGIENKIVPQNDIPLLNINISGLRKKGLVKMALLPFMLTRAFFQCLTIIFKHRPDIIIGFGGYATFPLCCMGWILSIPVLIHEQNSVSGLTNRILAKFAAVVMVAFDGVLKSKKTVLVGNPVREDILNLLCVSERYNSRQGGLNLLIMGGSLGAQIFNELIPEVCAKLSNINQVVHQVGRGDVVKVQERYQELGIHNVQVMPFIHDIAQVYADSDLIICRSGASTVSEIAAVGIAAIFVPYPHAVDNHQWYNAQELVKNGGAYVLSQSEFSVEKLASLISSLDRAQCLVMAEKSRKLAIVDSTDRILSIIEKHIV
ncbi:MAG: UDP-N-acetylglucosamine--N-acetylmuramyl-(pentapeptide) pyrophosphoryl-undecaprenol [Pseudomonadota bacterium]|nr:UDP-N-acetylglucosamine--N-acetylmuramyl-(pentapeptide) pyrophosphoryl-undecaprenol [Pseudomonadota bacterium]